MEQWIGLRYLTTEQNFTIRKHSLKTLCNRETVYLLSRDTIFKENLYAMNLAKVGLLVYMVMMCTTVVKAYVLTRPERKGTYCFTIYITSLKCICILLIVR